DVLRDGRPEAVADPQRAAAIYEPLAAAGDLGARLRLADMQIKGEGMPADPGGGLATIAELAEGSTDIGLLLQAGNYYSQGAYADLVEPDTRQAIAYFKQAADLGNADAAKRIGDFYRSGRSDLPQDLAKAAA